MPLSPYLSFAGNCADAIAYYQQTLGAKLLHKLSFGEMPPSAADNEEGCPSGMHFPDTAIAHANMRIAGSDIMMAMPSRRERRIIPALRWCLIPTMWKKGNAGLITLPHKGKSKWTGRRPSGRMVSARSAIGSVYRG